MSRAVLKAKNLELRRQNSLFDKGSLVPLTALLGGESTQKPYIYKYDRGKSIIQRIPVILVGVRKDKAMIQGKGLEPGDIIVAAGVSFLVEGQSVRLLERKGL